MTAALNHPRKHADNTAPWLSWQSYFNGEPPTLPEAIVLQTLKALCDDGDGEIADYMADAFLKCSTDQRTARRRAYALLRMARKDI